MVNSHEAEDVSSYFLKVYPEGSEQGPEALATMSVPHGLADVVWAQWLAAEPYHDRMLEDGQVMRDWVDATVREYNEKDPYKELAVMVELYRANSDSKLRIFSYLCIETERQLLNSIESIQLEYEDFEITEVRDMVTNRIVPLDGLDEGHEFDSHEDEAWEGPL